MKKYSKLLHFLKKNIWLLILCIVFNVISGYSKSAGAIYLQRITDSLEAKNSDYLLAFVLIGGGLTFASYVLRWFGAVVPNYLTQKFSYETRVELFTHLSKIPFIKYEGYSQGELISIIQNDIGKAGQIFYTVLSRMFNNIFLFIFSVWVMAATNVPATIISVLIVIGATAVNQLILKRLKTHEKEAQQNMAEMIHSLESTFTGMETVKIFWAKDYVMQGFMDKQESYCKNKLRSTRVDAVRTIWFTFIENLCLFGSVAYLGFLGLRGEMSIGEVMMFIYLVKQIIMPIEVVFRWMSTLTSSNASLERVLDKLEDEEEDEAPASVPSSVSSIKASNVSFAYKDGEPIIDNMSLSMETEKVTALSGASGTGKTTLLKILSGLYESPTAKYEVDGQNVSDLRKIAAYSAISNSLFPLTIYENVLIGNSSLTKDKVVEAIKELGFADWITSLPDGVDTQLNEDVSGGQRQVIANARALLSEKPFVILDEPYSALDAEKETALNKVLQDEKQNRIILLTSHREDAFAVVDKRVIL